MSFRLIPPGEFMMGSAESTIQDAVARHDVEYWQNAIRSEGPQHRVVLTKPIYMGAHEVTFGVFRQFVQATAYVTDPERNGGATGPVNGGWGKIPEQTWNGKRGFVQTSTHPVSAVSWNDATEFCRWLSMDHPGAYRLPSEAEWEFAAKSGIDGEWVFAAQTQPDGAPIQDYAWLAADRVNCTQRVGQKKPNALGLYDILGNAWEWVEDRYAADAYASANVVNPRGATTGQERVKRGGDIGNTPRATDRGPQHADVPYMFDGFRVALSVEAVRKELKREGPSLPPSAEKAGER